MKKVRALQYLNLILYEKIGNKSSSSTRSNLIDDNEQHREFVNINFV